MAPTMTVEQHSFIKQADMLLHLQRQPMAGTKISVGLQTFGSQCLLNKQKLKQAMFVQQTRQIFVEEKTL